MKKLYLFLALASLLACKKETAVGNTQEDLVIQAMTSGSWKVSNYTRGGVDVTSDFQNYTFQFKTNMTVDALSQGTLVKTGSWSADASSQTITSQFASAAHPLPLLNGTFQITNTTWTSVNASQTVSGELRTLRLDKL